MVYKFTFLSDEEDDFVRIIEIDSDAKFFDLHEAILDSVGFTKDQITSFFLCSDDWEREQEITLIEMETDSEYDNLVMDETVLSDYIEDEKQKLVYVFDILAERMFFLELTEIITRKNLSNAICSFKKGEIAQQIALEEIGATKKVETIIEDLFDEENIIDIKDLDEESFSDIDFTDESIYGEEVF